MLLQGGVETIRAVEALHLAMGVMAFRRATAMNMTAAMTTGMWQSGKVDLVLVVVVMVTTTTATIIWRRRWR